MAIELNHQELNILLYLLDDAKTSTIEGAGHGPSCEESCPVVDHLDEMFGQMTPQKKLANHLNNHLREGMLECGFLEVAGQLQNGDPAALGPEDRARWARVNERLQLWRCEINLDGEEQRMLKEAISRLPRSAWLTMPRTLWRLRKKLL